MGAGDAAWAWDDLRAVHFDGEHVLQITIGVYGNGGVHIASTERIHDETDEDCDCEPCISQRCEDAKR